MGANDGPPFTIQRLAEVLISPERVSDRGKQERERERNGGSCQAPDLKVYTHTSFRFFFLIYQYYTQTHKLCNCLEKLLLVTSSSGAFGGSTGGDTSQSRREVRSLFSFVISEIFADRNPDPNPAHD